MNLAEAFSDIGIPPEGVAFLMKLWDAIQFLDDVYDRDEIENVSGQIYNVLVSLPSDPFLAQHRDALVPAIATMYHKWQAANAVEEAHARQYWRQSYMWRAGFYDVALLVAALTLPAGAVDMLASRILGLYGEAFEDYEKEMNDA